MLFKPLAPNSQRYKDNGIQLLKLVPVGAELNILSINRSASDLPRRGILAVVSSPLQPPD